MIVLMLFPRCLTIEYIIEPVIYCYSISAVQESNNIRKEHNLKTLLSGEEEA